MAVLLRERERERVGYKQSNGETVSEEEAVHAVSLFALSRTRRDFAGHSSDRASEAKEADRRGR